MSKRKTKFLEVRNVMLMHYHDSDFIMISLEYPSATEDMHDCGPCVSYTVPFGEGRTYIEYVLGLKFDPANELSIPKRDDLTVGLTRKRKHK